MLFSKGFSLIFILKQFCWKEKHFQFIILHSASNNHKARDPVDKLHTAIDFSLGLGVEFPYPFDEFSAKFQCFSTFSSATSLQIPQQHEIAVTSISKLSPYAPPSAFNEFWCKWNYETRNSPKWWILILKLWRNGLRRYTYGLSAW